MFERLKVGAAAGLVCGLLLVGAGSAHAVTVDESLWYVDSLGLSDVHGSGVSGEGVTVAVVDTAVNTGLPEFGDAVEAGRVTVYDSACAGLNGEPSSSESDSEAAFHGTSTVLTVVGDGTDEDGEGSVLGVAPDVDLMFFGVGETEQVANCTLSDPLGGGLVDEYDGFMPAGLAALAAVRSGADIVNVSLSDSDLKGWTQVVEEADEAGVLIVASVPNPGTSAEDLEVLLYPRNLNGVVTVNAHTSVGEPVSGSLEQSNAGFVAPGDVMLSRMFSDGEWRLAAMSGTSYAAPVVSGALALYMSAHPGSTPFQALQALAVSSSPEVGSVVWEDRVSGYGVLNVEEALLVDPATVPDSNLVEVEEVTDERCGGQDSCVWAPTGPYVWEDTPYNAVVDEVSEFLNVDEGTGEKIMFMAGAVTVLVLTLATVAIVRGVRRKRD